VTRRSNISLADAVGISDTSTALAAQGAWKVEIIGRQSRSKTAIAEPARGTPKAEAGGRGNKSEGLERHWNLAGTEKSSRKQGDGEGPITIKKYANRRLYNTATSSYVTLDHLCQMVQDDVDFVVYDAKSGEDITRSVLTQIIVEEESKGQNLLPINFLRQLISFYGDSMQWMVPRYLEHMMEAFSQNQDRMRQSMQETFGGMFPFGNLEEVGKQNMALFESAMRMFSPFGANAEGKPPEAGGAERPEGGEKKAEGAKESLDALKAQIDQLQQQIDTLNKNKP
jgi:polyhydroxyalkanoate synthesis repressor PhaR